MNNINETTLTAQEKMKLFDLGKRKENIKACSDQKLLLYQTICQDLGYSYALDKIDDELIYRGLIKVKTVINSQPKPQQKSLVATVYEAAWDIIDFNEEINHNLNKYSAESIIKTLLQYKDKDAFYATKQYIIYLVFAIVNSASKKLYVDVLKNNLENVTNLTKLELKEILEDLVARKDIINKISLIINNDKNSIKESIEKHEELNPKLWNKNDTLKTEVKEKIKEIVAEFLKSLQDDKIKFITDDIILVGSNCSYNYTKDSDLDIHIIANTKSLDCPENLYAALYSAYRSIFNSKLDIDFYGIPVELYVETDETPRISNGVFSVKNDKWIKKPVIQDIPELNKEAFDKEFKKWEDKYNTLIEEAKKLTESEESNNIKARSIIADQIRGEWDADKGYTKAVADLKELEDIDTEKAQDIMLNIAGEEQVHVGELETVYDAFDPKLFDNIESGKTEAKEKVAEQLIESKEETKINKIEKFIEDIYDLRKAAIATEGEYSIGNLVFKELRNKGYLDNLKDIKNKLKSQDLSLE